MSATRWHLVFSLVVYIALLSVVLLSFAFPHYEWKDCSLYVASLAFKAPFGQTEVDVFVPFPTFQAEVCPQSHRVCGSFCDLAARIKVAGVFYTVLSAVTIALLLTCLLHLLYLNLMRPVAYSKAYIVHILNAVSFLLAGSLHLVISGCAESQDAQIGLGTELCWVGMSLAAIGALHYVYINKKGLLGLRKLKYAELEGTHIEVQGRPSSEEVQLEMTEPSGDEKRNAKARREIEDLREKFESEANARKSLLADNQMLARQVEEREKTVRELEQKVIRCQNNVQVTAALALAKQKEEEVGKLLTRIHDLDERLIAATRNGEELKGRLTDCERRNEELGKEVASGKEQLTEMETKKDGDLTETVTVLQEELLNAKDRLREKEREAQMIVRSAKERESEEVDRLTKQLVALQTELSQAKSDSQLQDELRATDERRKAEVQLLTEQLAAKNNEIAAMTVKNVDLAKQFADSTENALALLGENEELKKSNEDLSKLVESLQKQ